MSEPEQSKRHRFILIAALVVLVVIAAAVIWWLLTRNVESTDDAYVDARLVRLSSQIAGRVLHVYADDNRRVSKGELLVEIDPADATARLDQAQAQVGQAEAQIAAAGAQLRASEANGQQARAMAAGTAAQAAHAARDLARYRGLEQTMPSAVAVQQVDQARTQAVNSAAQQRATTRQVRAAAEQVDVARAQLTVAQAQLKSAQAQVEQARLTLGYTRLLAPCDGTIANRSVAVGDFVQAGQDLLAVVPLGVWITANFKETKLARMRPGDKVDIKIDAYSGVKFTGHVDSIQRGAGQAFSVLPAQNATGNFVKVVQRVPVKILIDGPKDGRYVLGPGMSVEPSVHVR
ncbi:MAG: efflux RND transporter periplasmic adaptor subunit [Steroidobacteraceae bacterium]